MAGGRGKKCPSYGGRKNFSAHVSCPVKHAARPRMFIERMLRNNAVNELFSAVRSSVRFCGVLFFYVYVCVIIILAGDFARSHVTSENSTRASRVETTRTVVLTTVRTCVLVPCNIARVVLLLLYLGHNNSLGFSTTYACTDTAILTFDVFGF